MRKSKMSLWAIGIVLTLCSVLGVVFSLHGSDNKIVEKNTYAACQKITNDNDKKASKINTNVMPSDMGSIPFSIFTSRQTEDSPIKYQINDYVPTFTKETTSGKITYTIDQESIPYILLSSKAVSGTKLQDYYDTTLYFKFNDHDIKARTSGTIATTGYAQATITLQTSAQPETINIKPQIDQAAGADDAGYTFALNLIELTTATANEQAKCPELLNGSGTSLHSYLGGDVNNNDVSYRTGLYTISIDYYYSTPTVATSAKLCTFEVSFYVLDYSDYAKIDGSEVYYSPIEFENTDLYTYKYDTGEKDDGGNTIYEDLDTGYNLFNYNYRDFPKVKYNPSNFALNFYYTVPTTNKTYSFTYKKFEYVQGQDGKAKIYIHSQTLNDDYVFDAEEVAGEWEAEFDLKAFEQDFILVHSEELGTTSAQGRYSFFIDMLTRTSSDINLEPIPVNIETFDQDLLSKYVDQKLVIFGYELRYNDKDENSTTYRQDIAMENVDSWTTFVAKNSSTANYNKTFPNILAKTNQAPLRFNSYGNLIAINGSEVINYQAKFIMLENEANLHATLSDLNDATTNEGVNTATATIIDSIKGSSSQVYRQSLPISGDGLYLMLLTYQISVPFKINGVTNMIPLDGEQIVAFQIDNTAQMVYPHAMKDDEYFTFDKYTQCPVRISTIDTSKMFYSPLEIKYSYYPHFNENDASDRYDGTIVPKQDGSYTLQDLNGNNKNYIYYVISGTNNDYTFSANGTYVLTIKDVANNSSSKTMITIDNSSYQEIALSKVEKNNENTYNKIQNSQISLQEQDIAIVNGAFSLYWKKKEYAPNYTKSYICYIPLEKDNNESPSLYKEQAEYWLTNTYKFGPLAKDIEKSYGNSYGQEAELSSNMIFRKDGLYIFHVYDLAGNTFTKLVLLDSSAPAVLQGRWNGTDELSTWMPDEMTSDTNYVNQNTNIYFGTHKALVFSDLSSAQELAVNNSPFIRHFGSNGVEIDDEQNIKVFGDTNDLNAYIRGLSDYINVSTSGAIIGSGASNTYYFLVENTSLDYFIDPWSEDIEDGTFNSLEDIAKVKIYTSDPQKRFTNEHQYVFTLTNANEMQYVLNVEMNFDTIQGIFYAYNSTRNNKHFVSKGSGTNLNVLMFVYNEAEQISQGYTLKELSYKYYPFDYSKTNTSYPFSTDENISVNLLDVARKEGDKWIVDEINLDYSEQGVYTRPGKYVFKRVYKGGAYDLVSGANQDTDIEYNGRYYRRTLNGEGGEFDLAIVMTEDVNGDYILVPDGEAIQQTDVVYNGNYYRKSDASGTKYSLTCNDAVLLFKYDIIERTYVVYVDRNGIITYEGETKVVGDNINLILNYNMDEEWTFADFFKFDATSNPLTTNKLPVKVNIPLSKYFYYRNVGDIINNYVFAKEQYARLQVTIIFEKARGSSTKYTLNTYDELTGLLYSSTLPNGKSIFAQEGKYTIRITDKTGYYDYSSTQQLNVNPNSFEFVFYIEYAKPQAQAYVEINNNVTILEDLASNNSFATNINKNNKAYFEFSDPANPYTANITKVVVQKGTLNEQVVISSSDAKNAADGNHVLVSSIKQESFIKSVEVYYYDENTKSQIFDGKQYSRFTYKVYLNIISEGTFYVTLYYTDSGTQYIGTNDEDFSNNTYTFVIDRQKPKTNVQELIKKVVDKQIVREESFLFSYYSEDGASKPNINNFYEENLDVTQIENIPTIYTYTFLVNEEYKLQYSSAETTPYFYVRSYNKEYAKPSITPDMISYVYDEDKAYYTNGRLANYTQFSEIGLINNEINLGNNVWYKVNYDSSKTLATIIKQATNTTTLNGYYEIIERDYAGNYRAFSVYYLNESQHNLITYSGNSENDQYVTPTTYAYSTKSFEITSLSSLLDWAKIRISNTEDSLEQEIVLTPTKRMASEQELAAINQKIFNTTNTKARISLVDYNNIYKNVSREINISTGDVNLEDAFRVSESGGTYTITLPSRENNVYLTYLKVEILRNGEFVPYSDYEFTFDDNSSQPNSLEGLPKGRYRITYKDNINTTTTNKFTLVLGESTLSTDKRFTASNGLGLYNSDTHTFYSGESVTIKYEQELYIVKVNNSTIVDSEEVQEGNISCKTFTLSSPFDPYTSGTTSTSGGMTTYFIDYYDSLDTDVLKERVTIVIYDKLPGIILKELLSGNPVASYPYEVSAGATNTSVLINWGDLNDEPYLDTTISGTNIIANNISATLYRKNDLDFYEVVVQNLSKNYTVSNVGSYKLVVKNNTLGNVREVFFMIQDGEISLFSVKQGSKNVLYSSIEKLDFSAQSKTQTRYSVDTNIDSVLKVLYNEMLGLHTTRLLRETVSKGTDEFAALAQDLGFDTDNSFDETKIGISNVKDVKHFYVTGDYELYTSSLLNLKQIKFVFKNNEFLKTIIGEDVYVGGAQQDADQIAIIDNQINNLSYITTIYLLYTFDGPIKIELLAVTKVPETETLLGSESFKYRKLDYSTNTSAYTAFRLNSQEQLSKVLYSADGSVKDEEVLLSWNTLADGVTTMWYNQGNYIYLKDRYGNNSYDNETIITTQDDVSYTTIKGSGTHLLTFSDLAGNTHTFATGSSSKSYYTISVIEKVVYSIRFDDTEVRNPVQYGVFNDALDIIIDSDYLGTYYTIDTTDLSNYITATRNGVNYPVTLNSDNTISFTSSGRYQVSLNAKLKNSSSFLTPTTYNFTIVSTKEKRLAFEFVEIDGYSIDKVLKNDVDITSNFADESGDVKSLFLTSSSRISGNGKYVITMRYGSRENETLEFEVYINEYTPVIYSSIERGGETTDPIKINFNAKDIYDGVGNFSVIVQIYDPNSEQFALYGRKDFNESNLESQSSSLPWTLSQAHTYFIILQTENGNVLTSFKVTKNEPLNSISILIIILSVVAAGALTFVIIKLRTKMKIR